MCNFLSGLTFSDFLLPTQGRCHADPIKTNSHSELVRLLGINDVKSEGYFAKWEFVPSGDIADFDNYAFKLDEERVPDWWTPEIEAETIEYAKSVLRRVVLATGTIDELRYDVYALAGNVAVKKLYSSVHEMRGSSSVGVMRGSSSVNAMWGSSSVGEMLESSSVRVMLESSSVRVMRGSSSVGVMRDSSSVREMWGSSSVHEMRGPSSVGEMLESSSVGVMRGSSSVRAMWESSSVRVMWGSSSVREMRDSPSVRVMWGSSQATVYTEAAHVTLGENCNAVVIDRSGNSVKCHVSGKRKKTIGSPRGGQ